MSQAYYHFKIGKNLSRKQDFLRAIMHLEKAKRRQPHKASIREMLATAYYNCGFYSSARKNFEKALKIDASNDFAYYGLGLSMAKMGDIKKARGQLKIALFMNPECEQYKNALNKLSC